MEFTVYYASYYWRYENKHDPDAFINRDYMNIIHTKETERERERDRKNEREGRKEKDIYRENGRERQRDRGRERKRGKERERERKKEKDIYMYKEGESVGGNEILYLYEQLYFY